MELSAMAHPPTEASESPPAPPSMTTPILGSQGGLAPAARSSRRRWIVLGLSVPTLLARLAAWATAPTVGV